MENTDGNAGTPGRMESADGGRAADDRNGIQVDNALDLIATNLERAQSQLQYGRRQEAEGAIVLIAEARQLLSFYRSLGEGQPGSQGLDGQDS